ncbi:MAG TPA: LLM class F420-dependent oxidoreductase [Gammaproteobacteria bacterium]|mgnify:CR=1 FL=1|nr:LLM class F420-dependent oxidoreductase [Gammaproteobacteria bacterium]|tara:strand:- start:2068 stop:3105 length:1038 start_codon:yes stop_codon:yes gene_type:complete
MKLGMLAGAGGARMRINLDLIKRAESMGYDSVWTAEAWGSDAVTPATWILANTTKIKVGTAIMQMPARTPAMAAMTAMSLSELSHGRFIVGLGASGPQVVEGWHGVPYGKPIARLKEYVQIMKQIFRREAPLSFEGDMYQLPYSGPGATGLGKPLKSILHCEEDIPIFAANITPKGVAAAAEVCDGFFPIWMDPEKYSVFADPIGEGFAAAGEKNLTQFEVSPFVTVVMGDNVEKCMMPIRANMALYIGGMGARSKNFYNNYATALGFGDAAVKIQDLFLAGRKDEAAAAVPAELIDACHLVGPAERIKERLGRWRTAASKGHVASMLLGCQQPEVLELIANEVL